MTTVGEVADFLSGGTPQKGVVDYWGGDIPWFSASTMKTRFLEHSTERITTVGLQTGSRLAPAGSTLILVRGSGLFNYIPICFASRPVAFNQDVKALVPKEKIDPLFLHYVIEGHRQYLTDNLGVTGIGAGKFDTEFIKALSFPDVDFEIQKELGLFAASFDQKIELNRKMNETLEVTARAIFKDWFVDFGPSRAKMEGREPYLTPDLWALFPDRLDDEGKPVEWEIGKIGDVAEINPESWSARNAPEHVEYVDLANTKWGTIEKTESYQWNKAPSRARRILRVGDTIVGTVRPGNGSYAFIGTGELTGSTGFAVLRPKQSVFRELVYCAATSSENIERLAHLADGGAYPAIRPEVAADTLLLRGSKSLDVSFSILCGPLIDCIEANKRENQALAKTRDILLPKLMTGEIRVKDIKIQGGEAA